MLANLLQVPTDDASWNQFSFNLREEVDRINAAILAQNKVNLPSYQLDPINWDDVYSWLAYLSQAMDGINTELGLQSQDVLAVDLRDVRQLTSWVNVLYNELYSAENVLQI
jgi:hypothetical protein